MTWPALLVLAALATVFLVRLAGHVTTFRVSGESMRPTLLDGDFLLVRTTAAVAAGEIAVLRDPRAPDRELVKRVISRDEDGLYVLGDNPAASTDSRQLGSLPADKIVGSVLLRYWPPGRLRWFGNQ
ncbi:MAG: nickel-type superoxide dismutase maturation protease [Dehalococcoidia bacterium]